jgi:MFS family permease
MFRAFRSRNFVLLWSGTFAANIGIWMQSVALGWLIYNLTSSASWLGRVSFAGSAPSLIFGLVGGAIADRADRKRILWASACVFAAGAFTLAFLTAAGVIEIWMVILISLITGTANAVYSPVFQTVIPTLVKAEDLMNAISLNSISFNGARIVGPALAGIVVARFGSSWCFALNGCGFLVMVATALALDLPRRPPVRHPPLWHTLRAGLVYTRRHRLIRALILLTATMSLFGFPYIVLMPALARDVLHLDVAGFGYLFSSVGAGAVVAGLALALVGDVRRTGLVVASFATAFGLLIVLLTTMRTLTHAMLVLATIGYSMITSVAALNTLIQVTVAEEMRGRVMSMLTVCLFGLPTLGALLLGTLGDRIGIPHALALGGAIVAVTACVTFATTPELRTVTQRAAERLEAPLTAASDGTC